MKKSLLGITLAVAICAGCTTSHPKQSAPAIPPDKLPQGVTITAHAQTPAPVVAPAVKVPAQAPVTNSTTEQDLAALRQSYSKPAPVTTTKSGVKVTTPKAVDVTNSPAPVSTPVSLPKQVAKTSDFKKLIAWLIVFSAAGSVSYIERKKIAALWAKFLTIIRVANVVADLKNLASEAEAKAKTVEADVAKDAAAVEAKAESFVVEVKGEFNKTSTPAPLPPTAPAQSTATKAFAAAETKK